MVMINICPRKHDNCRSVTKCGSADGGFGDGDIHEINVLAKFFLDIIPEV